MGHFRLNLKYSKIFTFHTMYHLNPNVLHRTEAV